MSKMTFISSSINYVVFDHSLRKKTHSYLFTVILLSLSSFICTCRRSDSTSFNAMALKTVAFTAPPCGSIANAVLACTVKLLVDKRVNSPSPLNVYW